MEPLVGAAIAELAGMYVGLLDRGLVFGQGQAAAYHDDGKSIGPRHSGLTWPSRMLEFCVHGIVVHLRLGNCIGYSLRELNARTRHTEHEGGGSIRSVAAVDGVGRVWVLDRGQLSCS